MVRESARLADLAGDEDWALRMYRDWLEMTNTADAEFEGLRSEVADRVRELQG